MKFIWILILVVSAAHAQEVKLTELKVGDKFPDYQIKNVINYKKSTFDVSEYRGKLVILDLWGTTCTSCVNSWPRILKFQEKFKNDLQFVLIDKFEAEDIVRPFLERRKKLVGVDMNLPNSCRDYNLKALFPENGVPRYVWIGTDGFVRSITNGDQLTEANIANWINDGPQILPQIVDDWILPEVGKPLFVDGNGGYEHAKDFIWSSILTKGAANIPGGIDISTSPRRGYFITSTGGRVRDLYAVAYNEKNLDDKYYETFIASSRIDFPEGDASVSPQQYNYQLIAGVAVSRKELLAYMQDDLNRYFGYQVAWETVSKKCLVWKITDSTKVAYRGGVFDVFMNDTEISFDSVTVKQAIRGFEDISKYFFSPYPIIDETNYKGLLGLRFECNCNDPVELDKCFRKRGMRLLIEERPVQVLTIRKREEVQKN
jgi:thiol-disulfide isomerase/thioredoxin